MWPTFASLPSVAPSVECGGSNCKKLFHTFYINIIKIIDYNKRYFLRVQYLKPKFKNYKLQLFSFHLLCLENAFCAWFYFSSLSLKSLLVKHCRENESLHLPVGAGGDERCNSNETLYPCGIRRKGWTSTQNEMLCVQEFRLERWMV